MNIFNSLNQFVCQITPEPSRSLDMKWMELIRYCDEHNDKNEELMLARILLNALRNKITGSAIGVNIYEQANDSPQIQLFNILIDQFPFVRYSQHITNTAIVKLLRQSPEATLIDIGIGQGTQVMNILKLLQKPGELKRLTIIGIEPFEDALSLATQQILEYSNNLELEINFIPVKEFVESLQFEHLDIVKGKLVVNASLALHHIPSEYQRQGTIKAIKSLNPEAFFLIEPNVNHFTGDLVKRFENCYKHFHALFKVIDQLDISTSDKNALKLFFGREIEDIIGKEEACRFEKHELATDWIAKLENGGFKITTSHFPSALEEQYGVCMELSPESYFAFSVDDETVLAVICAN